MNKTSLFLRSLSVSLILIFLTNSTGFAKESGQVDNGTNCEEWQIKYANTNDRRIEIKPVPNSVTKTCSEKFTLQNHTEYKIGPLKIVRGYSFELNAVENNGNLDFLPYGDTYLISGLNMDVLATPDMEKISSITMDAQVTKDSLLFVDLPLFVLSLIPIPIDCLISPEELFLIANRAGPILGTAGQIALQGDFEEAEQEVTRVKDEFIQKVIDVAAEAGVECLLEAIGQFPLQRLQLPIQITMWLGKTIYETKNYGPVSITLSYTPPTPVSVFPKQEWIAFLNKNNIWLIRPDGTGLTKITSNVTDTPRVLGFKWSPNGKMLAYELGSPDGNAILLYDVETSKSNPILTGVEEGFDWSVTNKQLLFKDNGIWIYNLEKGNKRKIFSPPQDTIFGAAQNPRYSADSQYVMLSAFSMDAVQYYVVQVETGESSVILPANFRNGTCEWSPIETVVACTRTVSNGEPGAGTPEVVLLDVEGNILREIKLSETISQPIAVWSRSGKMLAVGYFENRKSFTGLLSLETGQLTPLASGFPYSWSPNGQWLLTWDAEQMFNMPRHLSIVDINTGEARPISDFDGLKAAWQPFLQP